MTEPRRQNLRYPGFDYSSAGCYFVTICAGSRDRWFGDVIDGAVHLNNAGKTVATCWNDLASRFPSIHLDDMILMPDHLHGIVMLGYDPSQIDTAPRLGAVVQTFKSISTVQYSAGVRGGGWPPFDRRLWQRNYFEHIIRDDRSLERHREYIAGNPGRWELNHNR